MGFKSELIAGHFKTSSALFVTISKCFLKCVSGHCSAGRPMTSGGDTAF